MTSIDETNPDATPLTDWLPRDVRPVHPGVYERRVSDGSFSCWNGRQWNGDAPDPAAAAGMSEPSRDQNASWRGLVEKSDLPCATCRGETVVDRGYDDVADRDLITECPDC